ncbi:GNAT family N-acetyltransferase [Herbiconiux sp.]|uniref:GNAT family N-acetyltransferase n=1 Tax=Herbiconiux sp. TaxID=1871186 RepID=UPI0025B8E6CB|nr:GNAT family N-acetyltransferase [Herbiconiux sp.]
MTDATGGNLIAPWPGPPWGGDSAAAFSALLTAYHLQTEHEKGQGVATAADLPRRYRAEIDDPASAFARDVVLLAGDGASAAPVGCVVLSGAAEVKRLWVDPTARGQGLATALVRAAVDAAVVRGFTAVRLSVWEWRTGALALYERLGFEVVEPWDTRPGLVCLRWDAPTPR